MGANGQAAPILTQQLLVSVAEQIKLPLMQIARQSELGLLTGNADLLRMQTAADTALRLIDNYVLSVQLSLEAHTLEVGPVSVASVLYDTGHALDAMAKSYGVTLELNIAGKYGPVMANRQVLESALISMGSSLIEALPALETKQLRLQLATHRCRYGIVAGLYSEAEQLSTHALRQGRKLYGKARQPLSGLTYTAGAGIFVADTLLRAMRLQLQVSRHHRLYGLGAILSPSNQLQLV